MYEKHGLMVKITNPQVLLFLRKQKQSTTNTEAVESALRLKLGVLPNHKPRMANRGAVKPDCVNSVGVKISDNGLIEHIISQKKQYGISYRHTVESAVIAMLGGQYASSSKCD